MRMTSGLSEIALSSILFIPFKWAGEHPSGVTEPTKKISGVDNTTPQSGCDLNRARPIVEGGPRKDCPISASTRATINPRWQRLKIRNFARVDFPVSEAPRMRAMPLSLLKTSRASCHSPGASISERSFITLKISFNDPIRVSHLVAPSFIGGADFSQIIKVRSQKNL